MSRKSRSLTPAAALGLALFAGLSSPASAEAVRVSFVQTNDISRMEERDGRGGFARLAAVVAAERAKGTVFFVHSGDALSPSFLSSIDKGAHIIDILNHMGLDAMVPGNHDFDFGPEAFQQRMSEATFPVLASNIAMPGGGTPENTTTDRIVEVEGVRFGFYGLTTEDTATIANPGETVFTDSVETGIDAAADLRAEGADIVVAVVHTPLDVDFALMRAGAADIVLSGHDEHLMAFFDGRSALTESGAQGERVVITDLTVELSEADGSVSITWEPAFRILDTKDVEPDAGIAALVRTYTDRIEEELGVEIGTTGTPLDSRFAAVRGAEAAIGNLVTDAMRETVGADVAIINSGGIRGDREYAAGSRLTRRDILAELPFSNRTAKVEVTGEQLRRALENGFSVYLDLDGRNPQVSGMTVTVDLDRPVGERVLGVEIGGAPLDPAATYTVAISDFMANGGDGYTVFGEGTTLIGSAAAQLIASGVIDYIAAKGTVAPGVEGRIVME